jgi:hypothetical protein
MSQTPKPVDYRRTAGRFFFGGHRLRQTRFPNLQIAGGQLAEFSLENPKLQNHSCACELLQRWMRFTLGLKSQTNLAANVIFVIFSSFLRSSFFEAVISAVISAERKSPKIAESWRKKNFLKNFKSYISGSRHPIGTFFDIFWYCFRREIQLRQS